MEHPAPDRVTITLTYSINVGDGHHHIECGLWYAACDDDIEQLHMGVFATGADTVALGEMLYQKISDCSRAEPRFGSTDYAKRTLVYERVTEG